MDRLNLTLFRLDLEQEAAIKELFEARGWDFVHEIYLPFLNFDETFLARTSFAHPSFATYDTTVASVEPETKRQGNSCASAISGVDVGHLCLPSEAFESKSILTHNKVIRL